ncbi:hypothetical protein [Bacillus wiedmannii]|nr:hypothetical protein [Bacillus wiedmannii]
MTKKKTKQLHLYLPDELHGQVKKLAEDECLNTSTYIRKALKQHVDNTKK